ncbi:MAG: HEAT repeat domain-containing protein [Anaerolineaceae bacterium]|nr:HEAT repeat domain-containing protein [Anaerolineaceae bacterium]
MENKNKAEIPFAQVIAALLESSQPFPPVYLHRFSDLGAQELNELTQVWDQIPLSRRQNLLHDLEDLSDADTLVSFDDLSRFALRDPDPQVRAAAIRLLWESQDPKLVNVYLDMLQHDDSVVVRSTTANALGQFIYLGELDDLPQETTERVENALIRAMMGEEEDVVRQRALESLGYSSRDEIPALIRQAFQSQDPQWIASALFAMGRSADPAWAKEVLQMLEHEDDAIQLEAVRAAGHLELSDARATLLELLDEQDELDDDLKFALIWALSEIGGDDVREKLEALLVESETDEEETFIEDALDTLQFTNGFGLFGMMDFDLENNSEIGSDASSLIEPEDADNVDQEDEF